VSQPPYSPPPPIPHPSDPGAPPGPDAARLHEVLSARDVIRLLRLTGGLASRNEPRSWRIKLLDGLLELFPATAAAAFILKNIVPEAAPVVVSMFDTGFRAGPQRQAFLQEFNAAPFRDLFSRRALDRFITSKVETFTALRQDLLDDRAWLADPQHHALRAAAGVDDCALSLHRGSDRGTAYALYVFRAPAPPALPHAEPPPPLAARFGPRERTLLHALHAGLDPMFKAEESTHRLNRATELPPRLRQTLECLLVGDTERQVAYKLSLSVHTVHDYVKALYTHFGVSSRGELLSKWMQTSGQLPPRKES
jgi:DNA-binding CsgD family transcriptional regulator